MVNDVFVVGISFIVYIYLVEQKEWAREIVETVIALEETVLRESSTYNTLAISDKSVLDVCPIDASKICLLDRITGDELGLLTIGCQRMDRFVEGALGAFVEKNGAEALNHSFPENVTVILTPSTAPHSFPLPCTS